MRKFIPILGPQTTEYPSGELTASFAYEGGVRFRNGYFEVNQAALDSSQKISFIKRPGLTNTTLNQPALVGTSSPNIHGVSENSVILYGKLNAGTYSHQVVYGTTVFAAPAGWWSSGAGHNTTGYVTSLDANVYGGYAACVTVSGGYGGLITGAAWTRITDADYASAAMTTEFAAMDGFLFQASANNRVWNSDQNLPATWTSTGYITSAIFPGTSVALRRLRQYLVLFKTNSIEFLENQGNPSPGSPLGLVKNLAQPIGNISGNYRSIANVTDGFVFVGRGETGAPGIYKLGLDLRATRISDQFIDSLLSVSLPSTIMVLPVAGHEFVIVGWSGTGARSLVYDNTTKTWVEWTSNVNGVGETGFYTGSYALVDSSGVSYISSQSTTNPWMYKISPTQYGDFQPTISSTTAISFVWISPKLDFDTYRRKFMSFLEMGYQMNGNPSGALSDVNVSMYYYDDDNTNSSAGVAKLASQDGVKRLVWRRLASFRHRRFVFQTNDSTNPMRFTGIEVDLELAEDDVD